MASQRGFGETVRGVNGSLERDWQTCLPFTSLLDVDPGGHLYR
jgi:hypothetical protein